MEYTPLIYKNGNAPKDSPAICIPGCSICCTRVGSGVAMDSNDYRENLNYNSKIKGKGNLEIRFNPDTIGAKKFAKFHAEILSKEVDSNKIEDLSDIFQNLELRESPLEWCAHLQTADKKIASSLADFYNQALSKYNISIDPSSLENINPSSFNYCEVHEAPRSKQCKNFCNYAAKFLPRLLKASEKEDMGEEFFTKLLTADSLSERFFLINYLIPRINNIEQGLEKAEELLSQKIN